MNQFRLAILLSAALLSANRGAAQEHAPNEFGAGRPGLEQLLVPGVQQELGLTDEQLEAARRLKARFEKVMADRLKRELDSEDRTVRRIRDVQAQAEAEYQSNLDQVLLPPQQQRLNEIALQATITRYGLLRGLLDRRVVQQLELDAAQRERLQRRSREIEQTLAKEIQALRKQAEQKLLDELTAQQREQFQQLLGEKFTHRPRNFVEPSDSMSDEGPKK